jgi:ubiquinone/menaquinone biosynthesis C-methylase UbiE
MSVARRHESSIYLHGTAPGEQRRLSRLNDLLNAACLRELNLRGGEKILDVGCGLAQFTRAVARAAGVRSRVLGIERDTAQLAAARQEAEIEGESHLVELREGDALALPLREEEWGTFDVAHTRFLLEHVADPLAVVRHLVRAVRPGGRIMLADDDHDVLRLWPEPPGFMAVWQAYIRTYDALGNDPYVGRRLIWLLHEAGAIPIRNNWIFFGGCAGAITFPEIVENMETILIGARAQILASAAISPKSFDDAIRALRTWARLPQAALWFATCWAEGTRPETL